MLMYVVFDIEGIAGAMISAKCTLAGSVPFIRWKILYFWNRNCAIRWKFWKKKERKKMRKKSTDLTDTKFAFSEIFSFKDHLKSAFLTKIYWFWQKILKNKWDFFQNKLAISHWLQRPLPGEILGALFPCPPLHGSLIC